MWHVRENRYRETYRGFESLALRVDRRESPYSIRGFSIALAYITRAGFHECDGSETAARQRCAVDSKELDSLEITVMRERSAV